VSCGKRELFDSLRDALLYRVGRVDVFSRHPGVSVVSYDG
jgi:hypothetical protein